ncbi:MAG: L-threonylcarbamoyladenylate synthase [Chitinophagaceae bacterium]|nr:L-threonylcarbamoyladenylate synthase [Chitinophagaceae bacterium]
METKIGNSIREAADWLRQNEVIAIPTETVYGLAGNALSEEAVVKIFKAKNRPFFNPLIIHTHSREGIASFVKNIPPEAHIIVEQFSPGPVTFLLEKKDHVPDLVTGGHHKVAVRIPNHPLTLSLLNMIDFPLAAPSANRFGYVSPTTANHVMEGLTGLIPYILDGGPCVVGVESTIVDFEDNEVIIRRKGGISVELIEKALGKAVIIRTHASDHPVAPGQLKSHYATITPLHTGNKLELLRKFNGKKIALIEFGDPLNEACYKRFNLSPSGDPDEAARNLFSLMRQADHCGADVIVTSLLPEEGLGAAVNDRLKRAEHLNKQDGYPG